MRPKLSPGPGRGPGLRCGGRVAGRSSAACVAVTGRRQRFVLHGSQIAHIADYLRAQVPGCRCLQCMQICHLCTCLNWLPMICAAGSRVQGRRRRWRTCPAGIPGPVWPGAAGCRYEVASAGEAIRRAACWVPVWWSWILMLSGRRGSSGLAFVWGVTQPARWWR